MINPKIPAKNPNHQNKPNHDELKKPNNPGNEDLNGKRVRNHATARSTIEFQSCDRLARLSALCCLTKNLSKSGKGNLFSRNLCQQISLGELKSRLPPHST